MRYLTKSKFKQALECPTKLYYLDRDKNYANSNLDDPFLKALANGGFQVGELAKYYYPDGIEIRSKGYDESVNETDELLKKDNVVIFEAAIRFKNLFIRVDILEKIGNTIHLIEVKSKSADPNSFEKEIWNSIELKKNIKALKVDWKPYIYDLAFQSYVLKKAKPELDVIPYLMCADTSKTASVDGLNQKFMIKVDSKGRSSVEVVGDITRSDLGSEILCKLDCRDIIDIIHDNKEMSERFQGKGFEEGIWYLASMYEQDQKIAPAVGSQCKSCEYRASEEGKRCGYNECWSEAHGLTKDELKQKMVFDVWNYKGAKDAIKEGKIFLTDLDETDFNINQTDEGLSQSERQWLQVQKEKDHDKTPYLDLVGLKVEFEKFKYPLHMIDFETCMAALPFNKDRSPYEQIAFQFSHHIIYEDGKVEHIDEFINSTPGEFPNFKFLRALKKSLEIDEGTIFRYSHHENTVLCQIHEQLDSSNESDKEELMEFIRSITTKRDDKKKIIWNGPRTMVDLLELVKGYYYSPLTNGSNSIKYVLPAILQESKFLQEKYSKPLYFSANFKAHQWLHFDENNNIKDPYKTLPQIFDHYDFETLELVMSDKEINNGGAALTAYAMMQFTHMSEQERDKICQALLRYCELDTLAMVMIYEHWHNLIKNINLNRKIA